MFCEIGPPRLLHSDNGSEFNYLHNLINIEIISEITKIVLLISTMHESTKERPFDIFMGFKNCKFYLFTSKAIKNKRKWKSDEDVFDINDEVFLMSSTLR